MMLPVMAGPELATPAYQYASNVTGFAPAQFAPVEFDADKLRSLIELFEDAEDASSTMRQKAERDVDYYDHKQLTESEVRELKKRNQPPMVRNLIRRKIKYLEGMEQSQRTDPRALPVTPKHEDDAHGATDMLRFVCQESRYDMVRSKAWQDQLTAGWGGIEITAKRVPHRPNPRVEMKRCPWDRMFWDPHSAQEDFSDATYLGMVRWTDRTDAIRDYGEAAAKVFDETVSGTEVGATYDDKPRFTAWVGWNNKRRRVRLVQMYFIADDGAWHYAVFTKGGYMECGPSVWLDEQGMPEHPYAWRSAYVDRDNNRFGEVREMIDTNDEVNKRLSKSLHTINTRQTYGSEMSMGNMSVRRLREELAKPDGHLSLAPNMEWGKNFGIIPTDDISQGNLLLLQEAKAHMEATGPNSAMLGKGASGASGRAILANQQGGAIETTPLMDGLRAMDHMAYRKVWHRVRQFSRKEEWVRVTDDMKNLRWVGMNAQARDENDQPVFDPITGQPVMQNIVAEMDVDIMIDDAPAVGTMQAEQFQNLVELARIGVQFPPKVYIAASDLRNKGELIQMLDEQGQPDPVMQAAREAELRKVQAEGAHKAAQAKKTEAEAAETMVGIEMARAMPPPVDPSIIQFSRPA